MVSGTTRLAVVLVALIAVAVSYAQAPGKQKQHKWADSFDSYKTRIRPLSATAAKACETQLRRVLEVIDANQVCAVDSECTLVREEPFGQAVPVRTEGVHTVTAAMTVFRASCNNEAMQTVYNSEFVHAPACVQSLCMVKTFFKK
jgi:hypothetical protein